MTTTIKIRNINFYTKFEDMNLEELKENVEALNTPATAFDILTIHKSISILEDKLNKLSEKLDTELEIKIKNGSEKRVRIGELVLEIYESHKTQRALKSFASLIDYNKKFILFIIALLSFIIGAILGISIDLNLIKLFF